MTEYPGTATQLNVGRPPLDPDDVTVETKVRMTAGVRKRIAQIVGPNRMADFIREAVDNELERRERARAKGE